MSPVHPFHAEALASIHAAAFPFSGAWAAADFAAQLALSAVFGLIHPAGGLILARIIGDEAEILTLAVAPPARRQGVGRALLDAAMRTAGTRGAASMFLEVAEANGRAGALYAAAGFRAVGRRRGYYADGGDALVLRAATDAAAAGL